MITKLTESIRFKYFWTENEEALENPAFVFALFDLFFFASCCLSCFNFEIFISYTGCHLKTSIKLIQNSNPIKAFLITIVVIKSRTSVLHVSFLKHFIYAIFHGTI